MSDLANRMSDAVNAARAYRAAEAAYWDAWQACNSGTRTTLSAVVALREAVETLSGARWALDSALRKTSDGR